jgi:addiction module HigA family antidote
MNRKRVRKPTHPGIVLLEDVLNPFGISITSAAEQLSVSRKHLSNVCGGKVRMSPELAAKIAVATKTTIQSWLNMQTSLDVWEIEQGGTPNVGIFEEHAA